MIRRYYLLSYGNAQRYLIDTHERMNPEEEQGQRYMRLKSDAAVIRLHIGQSLDSRQRSQHPRQHVCQH